MSIKKRLGAKESRTMALEAARDLLIEAIHRLVDDLSRGRPDAPDIAGRTLMLVLSALGDSLMGALMARALGLPREAARNRAADTLIASFALTRSGAG